MGARVRFVRSPRGAQRSPSRPMGQRLRGRTLLSIDLVKIALGQFDLGPAASMSLIYFLIILLLSWLFYTVMTKDDEA